MTITEGPVVSGRPFVERVVRAVDVLNIDLDAVEGSEIAIGLKTDGADAQVWLVVSLDGDVKLEIQLVDRGDWLDVFGSEKRSDVETLVRILRREAMVKLAVAADSLNKQVGYLSRKWA